MLFCTISLSEDRRLQKYQLLSHLFLSYYYFLANRSQNKGSRIKSMPFPWYRRMSLCPVLGVGGKRVGWSNNGLHLFHLFSRLWHFLCNTWESPNIHLINEFDSERRVHVLH